MINEYNTPSEMINGTNAKVNEAKDENKKIYKKIEQDKEKIQISLRQTNEYYKKIQAYYSYIRANATSAYQIYRFDPKNLFYVDGKNIYDGKDKLVTEENLYEYITPYIRFKSTVNYSTLYLLLSDLLFYYMKNLCVMGPLYQKFIIQQLCSPDISPTEEQMLLYYKNSFDDFRLYCKINGIYYVRYYDLNMQYPFINQYLYNNCFYTLYDYLALSGNIFNYTELVPLTIDISNWFIRIGKIEEIKIFIQRRMVNAMKRFFSSHTIDSFKLHSNKDTCFFLDSSCHILEYKNKFSASVLPPCLYQLGPRLPVSAFSNCRSYSEPLLKYLRFILGNNEKNLNTLAKLIAASAMPDNKLKSLTIITGSKRSVEVVKKFFKEYLFDSTSFDLLHHDRFIIEIADGHFFNTKKYDKEIAMGNVPDIAYAKNIVIVSGLSMASTKLEVIDETWITPRMIKDDSVKYIRKLIKSDKTSYRDKIYGLFTYNNHIPIVVFTQWEETSAKLSHLFNSNVINLSNLSAEESLDFALENSNSPDSLKLGDSRDSIITDLALYGLKLLSNPPKNHIKKQSAVAGNDVLADRFIWNYCKKSWRTYIKKEEMKEFFSEYLNTLYPYSHPGRTLIYDRLLLKGYKTARKRIDGEGQPWVYTNLEFNFIKFKEDLRRGTELIPPANNTNFDYMINKLLSVKEEFNSDVF